MSNLIHTNDYAGFYEAKMQHYVPNNVTELKSIILNNKGKEICIVGSKYSHGGHTLLNNAIYINMVNLNKLKIDLSKKYVEAESGSTWRHVLEYVDKYNLSVAEMQSYSNFSVGGSISVNCHGRGMEYGTIADTIIYMDVMLCNGEIRRTYPNDDLFRSVVGGYGGVAIIISAALRLVNNDLLFKERIIYDNTRDNFYKMLNYSTKSVFFNCNIYPYHRDRLVSYVYHKVKDININVDVVKLKRLQDVNTYYPIHMIAEQAIRRIPLFKYVRGVIEPNVEVKEENIFWRNYELSHDVNKHKTLVKYPTTTVLQEYMIPVDNAFTFLLSLLNVLDKYDVNYLNISMRYIKATRIPILNYSPVDTISFVLYYNVLNNEYGYKCTKEWTNILICKTIDLNGYFYLPYLRLLTKNQFNIMYNKDLYKKIKNKYDPYHMFSSQFLQFYVD